MSGVCADRWQTNRVFQYALSETDVPCNSIASVPYGPAHQGADIFPMFTVGLVVDDEAGRQVSRNDVFLDRIDYGVDGETIAVGMGRYQQKCARENGRALCRERECKYGKISVAAVSFKKTKKHVST